MSTRYFVIGRDAEFTSHVIVSSSAGARFVATFNSFKHAMRFCNAMNYKLAHPHD